MSALVRYLDQEKFTMEKICSCLLCDDEKIKKSILNLLQIILSEQYDGMYRLITESRVESIILEEIQNQLPPGTKMDFNLEDLQCDPEYQILNLLNNVHGIIIGIKEAHKMAQPSQPIKSKS